MKKIEVVFCFEAKFIDDVKAFTDYSENCDEERKQLVLKYENDLCHKLYLLPYIFSKEKADIDFWYYINRPLYNKVSDTGILSLTSSEIVIKYTAYVTKAPDSYMSIFINKIDEMVKQVTVSPISPIAPISDSVPRIDLSKEPEISNINPLTYLKVFKYIVLSQDMELESSFGDVFDCVSHLKEE